MHVTMSRLEDLHPGEYELDLAVESHQQADEGEAESISRSVCFRKKERWLRFRE